MPELSSSLTLRYTGEQFTDAKNTKTLDSYTTADLSMNYAYSKSISLYGGINNLLDEEIDEQLGATVGRFFYVCARIEF